MNTKIVYVVISSDKDYYLEQMWVSLFSLRHFQEDVIVEVVTDDETAQRIRSPKYIQVNNMLDSIIAVSFESNITGVERSRSLKTSLRNHVTGDFLFLDTDTIITGSLEEIDSFDFDLGMVYSWHCKLNERPDRTIIFKKVKRLFNVELKADGEFFNSGVIYCKDTEKSRLFFKKWHDNWLMTKDKPKGTRDQTSLMVTVDEIGGVIAISGDYNCQPVYSMKYIATAKIVHFFNLKWANREWSPFCSDVFYQEIKKDGYISDYKKELILKCRSTFYAPTMCILSDDINIWRSSIFKLLRRLYSNHRVLYKGLNYLSMKLLRE